MVAWRECELSTRERARGFEDSRSGGLTQKKIERSAKRGTGVLTASNRPSVRVQKVLDGQGCALKKSSGVHGDW